MRTALRRTTPAALAIGALTLTAACGGSADADDKDGAKSKPASLSKEQVKAALLSARDLPAGWSLDKDMSSDNAGTGTFRATVADNEKCQPLLDGIVGSDDAPRPAASDVTVFVKGGAETAPTMVNGVTAYTEGHATELMKTDLGRIPAGCDTFTAKDDQFGPMKVSASELSVPELGDGSTGVRLSLDPDEKDVYSVQFDVAAVRVGGAIVNVMEISYTKADEAAFEQAIKKAVAKAEAAS